MLGGIRTAEDCTVLSNLGTNFEGRTVVFLLYMTVQLHKNRGSKFGHKNQGVLCRFREISCVFNVDFVVVVNSEFS
jgi:hypothetical protein